MKKKIISLMISAVLVFSCVPVTKVQAEEDIQDLPFTFENTDYGVKNGNVIAKKLEADNKAGITTWESGHGYVFVEKEGNSNSTYFLIGIGGCAAIFEGEQGTIPEVEIVASMGQTAEGAFLKNTLYAVKNPETGTYGIFNSTIGTYTDCQADRKPSLLYNMILIEKNGKYGLIDGQGTVVYEPVYDEISDVPGNGETLEERQANTFFIGKNGDKFAVLVEDGETSGDTFYRSVTSSSDGLLGVEQYDGATGEIRCGVLDLTSGDYIGECKYEEISEPDNGYFVANYTYKEEESTYPRYEVISRNESWDINARFGGYSVEIIVRSRQNYIEDGKLIFATYDRDNNRIFRGISDVSGNILRDYTNEAHEKWFNIERCYHNLVLSSDSEHTGTYYLEDMQGKCVMENIYDEDSVFEIGNYLTVTLNDGDVIFDPETGEIVLNGALGFLANDAVSMPGNGVVWFEEQEGIGNYGIFNANTGDFSGYLYDPGNQAYMHNTGRVNGENAIWLLKQEVGGRTIVTDSLKTVVENSNFQEARVDENGNVYIYEHSVNEDMLIGIYSGEGTQITEIQANYHDISQVPVVFATHTDKYGLIKKDGTRILADEYEYISSANYYGMSFVDVNAGYGEGTCGVIDANGNWLVQENYNLLHSVTDSYQSVNSGVTVINDGLTKYFYGFGNLFGEDLDTGELKVKETYPMDNESNISVNAGSHIRITFNKPVNIFNDTAVDEVGEIKIVDADTDETVLTYNMVTGSQAGVVRYLSAKNKDTIILENAFSYLQENKNYYVLMDNRCVREDTEDGKWFEGIAEGELNFSTRTEGMIEGNIIYLVACELTEQLAGKGEGRTVSEYITSPDFNNTFIWENQSATYRSLFERSLGLYTIREHVLSQPYHAGIQVFEDEQNKKLILVFDGTSLTDFEETFFKDSFEMYASVRDRYLEYDITITGTGAAGAVAAYVSAVENQKAVTFNAPIIAGMDMAYAYNTEIILGYNGIENVPCVNYSNHFFSGLANGGYHDVKLEDNPNGDWNSLNSLYEYTDDFTLTKMVSEVIPTEKINRVVMSWEDAKKTLKSCTKGLASAITGIMSNGTELYLGTGQSESWATNGLKRCSTLYSGGGDDTFQGGIKSNTFHYSGGNTVFKGGSGKDLYYINGAGGTVEIKDVSSKGYNKYTVLENGVDIFADLLEKFDIRNFVRYGTEIHDFVTGVRDALKNSDVIAVNTEPVSYEMVSLNDGIYTIQLSDCTIRVPQQAVAVSLLGLNGTSVTLAGNGGAVLAIQQARTMDAKDYSLGGMILEGSNLIFDVYVNGEIAESGSSANGSEEGKYFYTSISDDGSYTVLNLSDSVEKVQIKEESNLTKVTAVSLSDEAKSYDFVVESGRQVVVDCGLNVISYVDDGSEIIPEEIEGESEQPQPLGIEIIPPEIVNYVVGEDLNLNGMKVNLCYSNGERQEVTDYKVSGFDNTVTGRQKVQVSYGGSSNFFFVEMHPEGTLIDAIQIPETLEVRVGEIIPIEITINPEGGDDSQLIYESSDANVAVMRGNYIQAIDPGTVTVTIRDPYGRASAQCQVTVVEKQSEYVSGDIDADGIVNLQDLILLVNHLAEKQKLEDNALLAADIDENGIVNQEDLARLMNYVSKKAKTL